MTDKLRKAFGMGQTSLEGNKPGPNNDSITTSGIFRTKDSLETPGQHLRCYDSTSRATIEKCNEDNCYYTDFLYTMRRF